MVGGGDVAFLAGAGLAGGAHRTLGGAGGAGGGLGGALRLLQGFGDALMLGFGGLQRFQRLQVEVSASEGRLAAFRCRFVLQTAGR